ncbi:CDP-alcohol phosphatidyltransferase family protein [Tateyamaria armeniaca]|uniref:CDP-alcohol phosphatidyltransferase family protein n=1 Tax=Tateyamaria armeniaca TaxID=2518930 RepID=A0ABW8UTY3_9RHOB
MFRSSPHLVTQTIDTRPPLSTFFGVAASLGLTLALAAFYTLGAVTVPLLVFTATVMIVGYGLAHSYEHSRLGLCNIVTLSRAAMVAFIAGAVLVPDRSVWIVFGIAVLAFALDGVDGWLARRTGLVSDFGARFDMEVDAGLGAVISLWLLAGGIAGPEILILGFMRYAFVAASYLWPALQAPLPHSLRRKVICVVQIAALIILMCPLTPQAVLLPIGALAAVLLSGSFLTDILWLARRAG